MKKIKYIILAISILLANSSFSQSCLAEFTYSIDSVNQTIQFYDQSYSLDSNLVATSWLWTNEGTTFGNSQNPVFLYNSSISIICLTVNFDSCTSTICDTIYTPIITPTDSCVADFAYTLSASTNTITFSSTSFTNETICNYYWDFDDGTNSNQEVVTHTFDSSGTYNVCLTIETSADSCFSILCIDTLCQTIIIPPDTISSEISISGNVYAKTALLPEGIAVLYKVETYNYTAIEYTQINNGYYEFNNLDTGNYLVYALPYFGNLENYYPLYYPTYSGNNEHFADAISIFADSIETKDINLKYNEEINHGFGYISGKIVYDQGSNFETNIFNQNWFSGFKSNYEGVAQNITVLLYNNLGQVIKYSLSDENGNFEFKNIPFGLNVIYTEKAGKNTQVVDASLNSENDTIQNILIHIEETEIINIDEIANINTNVYPNPFNNYINIDFTDNTKAISIYIYNITGKQIFYRKLADIKSNNYRINTNLIKKGSYILVVRTGDTEVFRKKIIK